MLCIHCTWDGAVLRATFSFAVDLWLTFGLLAVVRVKEPQHESKTKSAPCTPCGNHDLVFDVDSPGNFDHSSSKLNEQSCAVSTPKLTRSVHAGVSIQQRSLDRHRSRPAAVGCSPIELTRGHADDDVHPVTNDHCRRQRRHRTRERHRSATR